MFGSKQLTYTGETEQNETRDMYGARKMDTKYVFIDSSTKKPMKLTANEVVGLVPQGGIMGGRMMRRQRSQRRGRQQRRQRTQRRH